MKSLTVSNKRFSPYHRPTVSILSYSPPTSTKLIEKDGGPILTSGTGGVLSSSILTPTLSPPILPISLLFMIYSFDRGNRSMQRVLMGMNRGDGLPILRSWYAQNPNDPTHRILKNCKPSLFVGKVTKYGNLYFGPNLQYIQCCDLVRTLDPSVDVEAFNIKMTTVLRLGYETQCDGGCVCIYCVLQINHHFY